MKNIVFFTILVYILLAAASCNMEKRLYRNGWYVEKHASASLPANPGISQQLLITNKAGRKDAAVTEEKENFTVTDSAPADDTASAKSKPERKGKTGGQTEIDPLIKMTYAQARASMAQKGCAPDQFAMTVYYMSLGSVFTLIFCIGFLAAIVTLILSVFAINKVAAAGGPCVEENIAIIKASRRICWGVLIFSIIAAAVMFAAIFLLLLAPIPGI